MEMAKVVIKGLLFDKEYAGKVFPHLKNEYFQKEPEIGIVYDIVSNYIREYNDTPTLDTLLVAIKDNQNLPEHLYDPCMDVIQSIYETKDEMPKQDWLMKETEKFCQYQSLYIAALDVVAVVQGNNKDIPYHGLPDLVKKAVSVSFDNEVGHSYFNSAEQQYDYYHNIEVKFHSKIDMLNNVTSGGIPSKTLNIFLAGINVGKTIWLVDVAADYLHQGKNVLFVTLEMAEEQIRQRLDANMFGVEMNKIKDLSREQYLSRVQQLQVKTQGNLDIKEYPAGQGHVGHIRHLINEIQLKKGYKPDLLCIDYLGIMASSRLKLANVGNTNTYFTEIAKELHGLGKEFDLTVWTAHQYTRGGQNSSDVDMTDTSAAIGIAATADFIIAGISNDELEQEGRLIFKQLKNRYSSRTTYKKFVVGIDRPKMTYYNVDLTEQATLPDSGIPSTPTPPISKDYQGMDFSTDDDKEKSEQDEIFGDL